MKHIRIILPVFISLALLYVVYYTWVKSPVLTHGFASYYTSARMFTDKSDMTKAYDTTYYFAKMHEYGFGSVKDLSNLPTGSFIMLPLCRFDPVTAKIIWNVLGLIFLFTSILLLFRSFDIPIYSLQGLCLILLTLLFYPFYYNIAFGQAYALLLLLASVSVYGFKKDNASLIAVPIALIIILKGYGFYPLAALLFMKKPKVFLYTVGLTAAIFLLTLPLYSFEAWQMYYLEFYSVVAYGEHSSNVAYQTMGSLLGHLLSYNSAVNTNALISIPKIYVYYFTQLAGLVTLFLFSKKFNRDKYLIFFVMSFALNVIFSPAAEDYHSLFYLSLIIFSGSILFKDLNFRSPQIYLFAIAVLLLMLPLPFRQLQDSSFPLYILAYPRLYGALILITIAHGFIHGEKMLTNPPNRFNGL
ncbi:MAG TPA: glycosyltransferase family 87 protein [Ignavibacteria bacterium]|nr:glycosyltransferase family 87 protein [Ignavibacteria bacterium]HMQ98962.1 glycosyltransferase family 87 protein [Ignavibacteria bacterium]